MAKKEKDVVFVIENDVDCKCKLLSGAIITYQLHMKMKTEHITRINHR